MLLYDCKHLMEPVMRYSKEHKLETRARIAKKASMRLRERGAHGIGVADLMKDAGLTHGGFYAHFDSREALVIEAFSHAMDRGTERWRKLAEQTPPEKRLATIVESYLNAAHRDDPGRSAQGRAEAGDGCYRDHDGDGGAGPRRRQWGVFRGNSRRRARSRARSGSAAEACGEEIFSQEGPDDSAALTKPAGNRIRHWSNVLEMRQGPH